MMRNCIQISVLAMNLFVLSLQIIGTNAISKNDNVHLIEGNSLINSDHAKETRSKGNQNNGFFDFKSWNRMDEDEVSF